ncbi:MAG: argininosuccinate lyase, partial [Spirochaetia bacterium]|nr:argininosuccinate lyase [Spirochaetia bacterium]
DLQEDKEGLFDAIDTTNAVLGLLPRILETLTFREGRMLEQCDKGFLPATDVADYLVGKGLPFREAHHVSGEIVKHLVSQNKNYRDLGLADFKKFSASFGEDIFPVLEMERIVENKKSRGSTSLASVEAQIKLGRELLAK